MPGYDLPRRIAAEALGTALLVATVVGSGIMAETLTKDMALALLGNTIATGAMLVVLITTLGPISGAHFNPAVSLMFALRRDLPAVEAGLYSAAQLAGGVAGTIAAHLMFALPIVQTSLHVRGGGAQWFSEGVATFGLVLTILAGIRFDKRAVRDGADGLAATGAERPRHHHRSRGAAMSTTIYHNPDCGTSRKTLAIIRASGTEPTIIETLKTPPTRGERVAARSA